MALINLSISAASKIIPPPSAHTISSSITAAPTTTSLCCSKTLVNVVRDSNFISNYYKKEGRLSRSSNYIVSCSLDTAGATVGQVTEVNKDTFWPIVMAAGDKTVVLDMYTQWCGPCKVMAPKFKELSEKYLDVVFLKLDCNQENKPLAKELGIRVVPTFKILKDNKIVKEVTGAKFDDLVVAIDTVRAS